MSLIIAPVKTGFGDLSDEIILQIFARLPLSAFDSVSSVCKLWQRISQDRTLPPQLWKKAQEECKAFEGVLSGILHFKGTLTANNPYLRRTQLLEKMIVLIGEDDAQGAIVHLTSISYRHLPVMGHIRPHLRQIGNLCEQKERKLQQSGRIAAVSENFDLEAMLIRRKVLA